MVEYAHETSCPDIGSIPKLAEILGVNIDELMLGKPDNGTAEYKTKIKEMASLILKAVPLAMGVGVVSLSAMKQLDIESGLSMLGIGLSCLTLERLWAKKH